MKGRFYKPTESCIHKPKIIPISLKKKDCNIRYNWKSSIPESWQTLIKKKNIEVIKINNKHEIDLKGLEDEQKHKDYLNSLLEDRKAIKPCHSTNLKRSSPTNTFLENLSESQVTTSNYLIKPIEKKIEFFRKLTKQTTRSRFSRMQNNCLNGKESVSSDNHRSISMKSEVSNKGNFDFLLHKSENRYNFR